MRGSKVRVAQRISGCIHDMLRWSGCQRRRISSEINRSISETVVRNEAGLYTERIAKESLQRSGTQNCRYNL